MPRLTVYQCVITWLFNTLLGTARPVVTFTPNWSAIFLHEAMSLSCNVDSAPQDNPAYSWYKDHKKINTVQKIHHIPSADWNAAGSYQCQAETGDKSDPVRLNITDGTFCSILFRVEQISLFLAWNVTVKYRIFGTSELTLQAELNSTGNYKCIKRISSLYVACVTELFPPPRVSISVDPVVEGAEMRVTCATLPQRAKTSLEFAFNRNGRKVQEFSSSDTYSVQSAQEDDAGNYTCEAKTSSSSVKKRSRTHRVTVKGESGLLLCDCNAHCETQGDQQERLQTCREYKAGICFLQERAGSTGIRSIR
uniref:Ig-like domain-containing protein n=1 Tax=Leptobrachium leishanense TaxID=445787 RepID=A0A8C5WIY8_9ANUR